MDLDVPPRSAPGVAVERMGERVEGAHQRIAVHQLLERVEIGGEGLEQGGKVGRVPLAGDVAFAEADVGRGQHPAHEAEIVDDQAPVGSALVALDPHLAPGGKDEGQASAAPTAA